jgi:outer membrane protein
MAHWIRSPLGKLERGMTRRVAVVFWAAALVLTPRPVLAAEAIPVTLTDALDVVDRQSPDLAAAREGVAAQSARADAMSRSAWPRLAVTTDWWHSDNPARVFAAKLNRGDFGAADFELDRLNDPASLSHLTSAATLEVPVDIFGKVSSRAAGERAAARALDASSQELRQDLRLRVVGAFEQARLAKAALRVAARALESARSREADVSACVEQGAALDADRLRVRARRRQREADVAGAQERWGIALAVLGRALGAPAGVVYEPGDAPPPPIALEGNLTEWQERAAAGRAVLAVARERRTGAAMARRAESRSLWPDVRGYAQLQDDRGPSASARSYAFGASLRWEPFDPSRGKRSAAAQADARASESAARAAADQVRLEVETAWRHAVSARERHGAAGGGAEEGREALRVIRERRASGMATLTDELETEAASLAAELEELSTAVEIALADAALKRAVGGL